MNGAFAASKVEHYLRNIDARILFTDARTLLSVLDGDGGLGGVTEVVLVGRRADLPEPMAERLTRMLRAGVTAHWIEDLLAAVDHETAAVGRGKREVLYLVHSSGTTGFPKAVILRNVAQAHAMRGWLCYVHVSRRRDKGYLAVPNNHQAVILSFNCLLLAGHSGPLDDRVRARRLRPGRRGQGAGRGPLHRLLRVPDRVHPAQGDRTRPARAQGHAFLGEHGGCRPRTDHQALRRRRQRVHPARPAGPGIRLPGCPGVQRGRHPVRPSLLHALHATIRAPGRTTALHAVRAEGQDRQGRPDRETRRGLPPGGARKDCLRGVLEQSHDDDRGHP